VGSLCEQSQHPTWLRGAIKCTDPLKNTFAFALALVAINTQAQDTCTCVRNLELVIDKVSRNYAGFQDKVNDGTRSRYGALVDSLRSAAKVSADGKVCFALLERYRAFFADKHLQLNGTHAPGQPTAEKFPPTMTEWTAASLRSYFSTREAELKPLEGIWKWDPYEVGIIHDRSTDTYKAIIISGNEQWTEGMLKFSCDAPVNGRASARFSLRDHSVMETNLVQQHDHLTFEGLGGVWDRTYPPPAHPTDKQQFMLEHAGDIQWKMLDSNTIYIKVRNCDLSNKAVLESAMATHATELQRTPDWIVDFRGNGGGSTNVFSCLLPYLYTKPMVDDGQKHWMSPENTAKISDFLERNRTLMSEESRVMLDDIVAHGKAHPNTWHVQPGDTLRFDTVLSMPRRVAVLVDRGTASSGEVFAMEAHMLSDKAVIFGEHTGGYLDYGDLMWHDLGCDGLSMNIPTSRMTRVDRGMRYDLTGFPPDVPVPAGTTEVIAFVREYWAAHGGR
jgi:hypothetical protein